jgi:hypothetical protein
MATAVKRKNILSDTWEQVPQPVKLAVYAFGAWKAYQFIQSELEKARQRKILRDQQNPIYNLQTTTWGLPGTGTTTTTQTPNVVTLAQEFYNAYNPEGWNTDEWALIDTLAKTPPQYFRQVESYYNNTYGRNLINDLDEQLLSDELGYTVWSKYKTQIY